MNFIGIDPGGSGAFVVLYSDSNEIDWFPFKDSSEAEIASALEIHCRNFDEGNRAVAVIERVHSMPRQGVASSFKFGQSYGFLRGLLTAFEIPFVEVTPQKWQKAMGCMTKGDKNVSKQRAGQLFPGVKFTHAFADAALIAAYCKLEAKKIFPFLEK